MHSTELFMRQQADIAREERRKESMKDAREQINKYLEQGTNREIAVNIVLNVNNIAIVDKKQIRKSYQYGCHTISSMAEGLSDIKRQNSLDLVIETI